MYVLKTADEVLITESHYVLEISVLWSHASC